MSHVSSAPKRLFTLYHRVYLILKIVTTRSMANLSAAPAAPPTATATAHTVQSCSDK